MLTFDDTYHYVYGLMDGKDVRYVGYSVRLEQRRKVHTFRHPGWMLITLGAYPTREIGLECEMWWIKRLHEAGHPLTNISEGGNGPYPGIEKSYLTRMRLSTALKGKRRPPEVGMKVSLANKGRPWSEKERASHERFLCSPAGEIWRAKLSAAHKGRPWTAAQRAASLRPETRTKRSTAQMGKRASPEARANMSDAHKGRRPSQETRAKRSAALKDRPWSAARRMAEELR